jgi:predicted component of type VI protein secretion system
VEATLNGPFGRVTLGPGNLTIGRIADNQLVVSDAKASSHHAEIRPNGQGYSIVDVGSTNGTFVNEQRIERNLPRPLTSGDTIRIGDTRFTYEVSGAYEVAPTVYAQSPASNDPPYQPTIAAVPPTAYGPDAQQRYQGGYQQVPPSPYEQQPAQPFYAAPPPPPYAPSPVGQPGMPAYGQPMQAAPGVPAYAQAPQPTAGKSRRGLGITLGVIGGVLLLVCVACVVFLYAVRSTPERTLTTFCDDLKSGNDHDAYQQLSSSAQQQTREADFAASMAKIRTLGGGLKNCVPNNVTSTSSSGTGTMLLSFNATVQTIPLNATLVDESSTWKINTLQVPQQ